MKRRSLVWLAATAMVFPSLSVSAAGGSDTPARDHPQLI